MNSEYSNYGDDNDERAVDGIVEKAAVLSRAQEKKGGAMKTALLHEDRGLRTYALIMDKHDEACAEIVGFARDRGIRSASITAIGASSRVTLGYLDPQTEEYAFTTYDEQMELASCIGDIADGADGPVLHAHAVLGRRDGSAIAGHLRDLLPAGSAIVAQRMIQIGTCPSLEVFQIEGAHPRAAAGLVDLGWGHVSLLVDDMAAVITRATSAGATALSAPHDNSRHEDTPGNASVYLRAPWGSLIELQALPIGHWYGTGSETEVWTPPRRSPGR